MATDLRPEEQRIVNQAATAVRRTQSCEGLSSASRRSLQTTVELLELWEDTSQPGSRPLEAVA